MPSRVRSPLGDERGVSLTELVVTLALFALVMVGVVMTWTKAQEAYFVGSETAEVQQNVRAAIDFMVRELRSAGRDVTVCAFDYEEPGGTHDCTDSAFLTLNKVANCQLKLGGNYNASNGQGGTGCQNIFAIPAADATISSIRIRSDRNDNGRIVGMGNASGDAAEENVKYALAAAGTCPSGIPGACITRNDGTGPVAMVAVDISGFQLTYYPRPGFGPCAGLPNPCPPFTLPMTQSQADNIAKISMTVTAVQTTAGQQISRTLVTDVVLKNRR